MIIKNCCGGSGLGAFGGPPLTDKKTLYAVVLGFTESWHALFAASQALCEAGYQPLSQYSAASRTALARVQQLSGEMMQVLNTKDQARGSLWETALGQVAQGAFDHRATCGQQVSNQASAVIEQLVKQGQAHPGWASASLLDPTIISEPICGPSSPTGPCPAGQTCVGGTCQTTNSYACSGSNPAGTCPAGQVCKNGACAPITATSITPAGSSNTSMLMLAGLGVAGVAAYLLFGKKKT